MKSFKISIYIFGVVVICSLIAVAGVLASVPGPGGPYSSAYRVQNLSTSATATCTYEFFDSSGTSAYTKSNVTIAPGTSDYFYAPTDLPTSGTYSGVVSCDQPVAAVVNFSDPKSGASFNGIDVPATIWYAPGVYNNYFGYYSNMVVQNASGSPVNITVDIFAPGSSVAAATQTANSVPAYASVSFDQTGLAGLSANVAYSAKITGTGTLAPVININGPGTTGLQLYSYNGFSSGSTTAYAPVIMNNFYGYNSALAVQNLGAADTTVTITYGTGQTTSVPIAANSSVSLYTPANGVPVGSLTGAKITSPTQPIVAIVNESNTYNRAASYSGFSTGGTTVVAPIVMKRYYNYNTSVTCQNVGAAATTMTLTYGGVAGSEDSGSTLSRGWDRPVLPAGVFFDLE